MGGSNPTTELYVHPQRSTTLQFIIALASLVFLRLVHVQFDMNVLAI